MLRDAMQHERHMLAKKRVCAGMRACMRACVHPCVHVFMCSCVNVLMC